MKPGDGGSERARKQRWQGTGSADQAGACGFRGDDPLGPSSSADSEVELSAGELPVHVIDLPKIADQRGNLTFIEGKRHLPFSVRRVYYLYDVPAGATRGGHAHRRLEEFVIAASGSFTVVVDDGRSRKTFFLNRPHYGLYIPRMVWRELEDFSSGATCVVLASEEYDESDYYREYSEYIAALGK
ncbi:MAG: sugar 3,4-ketoisomerase [Bryobacteraceae bacterium]